MCFFVVVVIFVMNGFFLFLNWMICIRWLFVWYIEILMWLFGWREVISIVLFVLWNVMVILLFGSDGVILKLWSSFLLILNIRMIGFVLLFKIIIWFLLVIVIFCVFFKCLFLKFCINLFYWLYIVIKVLLRFENDFFIINILLELFIVSEKFWKFFCKLSFWIWW